MEGGEKSGWIFSRRRCYVRPSIPPLQGRERRKRKVVREKIRRGKKGGREGDSPKQVDKEKEELSPFLLSWHSVVGRAEKGGGMESTGMTTSEEGPPLSLVCVTWD